MILEASHYLALLLLLPMACASHIPDGPTSSVSLKPADIGEVFKSRQNETDGDTQVRAIPRTDGSPTIIDRAIDDYELEGLMRLARKAEVIRGLTFRALPEVRVQNRAGIRKAFSSKQDATEIERIALRYRVLGLLDDDEDIGKEAADRAEARVLGYYDPSTKQLVLRDDVAHVLRFRVNANPDWVGTILHELVHALQDQHFDLKGGRSAIRSDDGRSAYAALIEGDATLAMVKYAAGHHGVTFESVISDPQTLETLILSNMRPEASINGPPALHDMVAFRYGAGAAFVASLLRSGGQRAVNHAFLEPPSSAAEILEPSRFHAGVRAEQLPALARATVEDEKFEVLEEQVLGTMVIRAFLAVSGRNSDASAASWTGDRFLLLKQGTAHGYIWTLAFSGGGEASDAYDLVKAAATVRRSTGHHLTVTKCGRFLLITGDIPSRTRARVAKVFTRWADRQR